MTSNIISYEVEFLEVTSYVVHSFETFVGCVEGDSQNYLAMTEGDVGVSEVTVQVTVGATSLIATTEISYTRPKERACEPPIVRVGLHMLWQ